MWLGRDGLPLGLIGLAAFLFVRFHLWKSAVLESGLPSPDVYEAGYPMLVQGWRSLWRGHGLLWNSLENAGQPYLPSTLTAPLYPLNVLFIPFGWMAGYAAIACVHLAIGGAGVYLLCREYGTGRGAALCGGFAFLLASSTVGLAVWVPTAILGGYVWMPVALLCLERTLRDPGPGRAVGLAVVLAFQLLAGFPQGTFFTYQLLGLRVAWQLASAPATRRVRTLAWVAAGLVLPAFLAAAYLLPGTEFMRQSIRRGPLALGEMRLGGHPTWVTFRQFMNGRFFGPRPFSVVPLVLAVAALGSRRRLATVLFFVLVAVLYVTLIFDNPVFHAYVRLPLMRTFRDPTRFMWVVFLALAVLAGLGADACLDPAATGRRVRVTALVAATLGGLAFAWLWLAPPRVSLWILFAATVLALLVASVRPLGARVAGAVLPLLVLWSLYLCVDVLFLRYMASDREFFTNDAAWDVLRARMTSQDRFLAFPAPRDLALQAKASSLVDLPTSSDYEPQTSHRFATYWVMMRFGQPMRSINDYLAGVNRRAVARRPLLDLTATRYVLIDPAVVRMDAVFNPPLRLVANADGVEIWENPQAVPRAYFVPRVRVVDDPLELLTMLANGRVDPLRVALVEAPPADGFLGVGDAGQGTVSLEDRSETVSLEVDADTPGFVVLTDQFYPGWTATVDGVPAEIVRANYAFRAVPVPAGHSRVRLTYRPWSVRVGTFLSFASTIGVLAYGVVVLRRRATRG